MFEQAIIPTPSRQSPETPQRALRSLRIAKGNHGVTGIVGPIEAPVDASILHAPIRSFDYLLCRVENVRRLLPGRPDGESWHLKRLLALSTE